MIVQHCTLTANNTACVHISVQFDAHMPVARMHFVDCVECYLRLGITVFDKVLWRNKWRRKGLFSPVA